MIRRFAFSILFFTISLPQYGQFLLPGEGIMDVKIGADWDEVEWELGFRGIKIAKAEISPQMAFIASQANIDFDFAVNYHHIMWLPITDLFFKDGKVCLIALNSYHEYNQMLCADIGTTEGLNFWNNGEAVKKIYGNKKEKVNEGKSYLIYPRHGVGVELLNDEVRTMFIFPAHMK